MSKQEYLNEQLDNLIEDYITQLIDNKEYIKRFLNADSITPNLKDTALIDTIYATKHFLLSRTMGAMDLTGGQGKRMKKIIKDLKSKIVII